MYNGDRAEGVCGIWVRLPSAFDNRPLRFEEFEKKVKLGDMSAPHPVNMKPALQQCGQIIRPTGLVDPEVIVRPVKAR